MGESIRRDGLGMRPYDRAGSPDELSEIKDLYKNISNDM